MRARAFVLWSANQYKQMFPDFPQHRCRHGTCIEPACGNPQQPRKNGKGKQIYAPKATINIKVTDLLASDFKILILPASFLNTRVSLSISIALFQEKRLSSGS